MTSNYFRQYIAGYRLSQKFDVIQSVVALQRQVHQNVCHFWPNSWLHYRVLRKYLDPLTKDIQGLDPDQDWYRLYTVSIFGKL